MNLHPGYQRFCVNPKCVFFEIGVPQGHHESFYHVMGSPKGLYELGDQVSISKSVVQGHGLRMGEARTNAAHCCHHATPWTSESRHDIHAMVQGVQIDGYLCGTCFEVFKMLHEIKYG